MQKTQAKRNTRTWIADRSATELVAKPFDFAQAAPAKAVPNPGLPAATASLVRLEQGLYALEVGELGVPDGQISGLSLPVVHVAAPPGGQDCCSEIIGGSGDGAAWLGHDGGTVVVKSPPGGGYVLVTAYGLTGQVIALPRVAVRRLDRSRSFANVSSAITGGEEPDEIRAEIVLHVERLGDRRFSNRGWIGNLGQKLRIEAFSIRPIETLVASDVEFKALGPNGRETPWVTDAKLCGTRGRGLPLTGFAVRLAPHVEEGFEVVYQGAFFESGVVGPRRNGELCIPPIADDALEAIDVRLIRRSAQ
jgi:hypothetical protein